MLARPLLLLVGIALSLNTIAPAHAQSRPLVSDDLFIAGEVYEPGKLPFKEGMTLREAIALAGGATTEAALNRMIIFRLEPSTGKRHEVRVALDAVMNGKGEKVELKPGDIVIVPSRRRNKILDTPPIPIKLPLDKSMAKIV